MKSVQRSILIDQAVDVVFGYLCDLAHDAEWRREWIESRQTSPGPIAVGSHFLLVGQSLGQRFDIDYETIAFEPFRFAEWVARSGPIRLRFSRAFVDTGGATRVTFTYDVVEPGALLRLAYPLFAWIGKRQLDGDFPELSRRLGPLRRLS